MERKRGGQQKWTRESIIQELSRLHAEGKSIRPQDVYNIYQAALKYRGGYQALLKEIGVSYENLGLRILRRWNKRKIIKELKKLHKKGVSLNSSSVSQVDNGLRHAAENHFGSLEKAVEAAGLDFTKFRKNNPIVEWARGLSEQEMLELRNRIEKLY